MLEKFAWEYFTKTGSLDGYLLYRQSLSVKENSGAYGDNQNQWGSHQADQDTGQRPDADNFHKGPGSDSGIGTGRTGI